MEQAKAVAARIARGQVGGGGGEEPPDVDEAAGRVVNALMKELKAIFPAWRQAWPDDAALKAFKKSMTKGFVAAGIVRIEQIEFGVKQCRQLASAFVPSVGQFIALCTPTPEALGLPSVDEAFGEATRNAHPATASRAAWSHDAVSHAAREVGLYNLANLPLKDSRALFERCYVIACRALVNGQPLRPILKALPEQVEAPRTYEVGRATLDEINAALRGKGAGDE